MSQSQTLALKALSVLLCYPCADMIQALPDIETALEGRSAATVKPLLEQFRYTGLLDLQENYVALFDRGRALSLHLFEHLHGESRDRGQAMVDLMAMYQNHGFELDAHELPDYIPLFLEFLAQLPQATAFDLLGNTHAILQALAERLEARDSIYAVLFDALLILAGKERASKGHIEKTVAETDETLLKMDEIWEEEAVTFMGNKNSCNAQPVEQTVKFTPSKRANVC